MKIFIDGREGTTGLQIQQRLEALPDIDLLCLDESLRKDTNARREALNAADVAFLCLPDVAACEAVSLVDNEHTVIIDASTAHRTQSGWAYGFPELSPAHRQAILDSKRIANPGCHASGFCALVYPLIARGIVSPSTVLQCFSITGYTGGGKAMIAEYERDRTPTDALHAPRPYALALQHKHLPEMTAVCGLDNRPWFLPIVGDFPQGMLVTVPLNKQQMAKTLSRQALRDFYANYYNNQPTIAVLPDGQGDDNGQLDPTTLAGKDSMEIMVYGNDENLMLTARLDNLGKGAAGAAVQLLLMKMNQGD